MWFRKVDLSVSAKENMALNYAKTRFASAACFIVGDITKNCDPSQYPVWKMKLLWEQVRQQTSV